jgi:hypothetical protein
MPSASTIMDDVFIDRDRVFVVVAGSTGVGGAEKLEVHGKRARQS